MRPGPQKVCVVCQGEFQAARAFQRYCSRKCRYRAAANRHGRTPIQPLSARLWPRLSQVGDCWVWQGGKSAAGYGEIVADGKQTYTHRVTYELLRADIPPGLELDHLCRNRACCNPWHLEPVTTAVNQRRGVEARRHVSRDVPSTWTEWRP